MAARQEVRIIRPEKHYIVPDSSKLSRFLGISNNNRARQEVIDIIVQLAAIEGSTWGTDRHKETDRTLGVTEGTSATSYENQLQDGRLKSGKRFRIELGKRT